LTLWDSFRIDTGMFRTSLLLSIAGSQGCATYFEFSFLASQCSWSAHHGHPVQATDRINKGATENQYLGILASATGLKNSSCKHYHIVLPTALVSGRQQICGIASPEWIASFWFDGLSATPPSRRHLWNRTSHIHSPFENLPRIPATRIVALSLLNPPNMGSDNGGVRLMPPFLTTLRDSLPFHISWQSWDFHTLLLLLLLSHEASHMHKTSYNSKDALQATFLSVFILHIRCHYPLKPRSKILRQNPRPNSTSTPKHTAFER
jgi:hypothetical protein